MKIFLFVLFEESWILPKLLKSHGKSKFQHLEKGVIELHHTPRIKLEQIFFLLDQYRKNRVLTTWGFIYVFNNICLFDLYSFLLLGMFTKLHLYSSKRNKYWLFGNEFDLIAYEKKYSELKAIMVKVILVEFIIDRGKLLRLVTQKK